MQHVHVNVRLIIIGDWMQMSDLHIPWNVTTLCTMWIPAAVTELSCLFPDAFPPMHLWNQREQIWKEYMCNILPETITIMHKCWLDFVSQAKTKEKIQYQLFLSCFLAFFRLRRHTPVGLHSEFILPILSFTHLKTCLKPETPGF